MSEHKGLLTETANKAFAGLKGNFSADWRAIEEAGLPWVMAAEDAGGIGGGFEDACAILRTAGRHAVALPIAEAIIAAALLAETGIAMEGALTLAKRAQGTLETRNGGFAAGRGCLLHSSQAKVVPRNSARGERHSCWRHRPEAGRAGTASMARNCVCSVFELI